jgi:hypothetical protein
VVSASLAGCATTEPSRVDPPQQVVVLDNGHMYRVVGDQAVMVNGNVKVRLTEGNVFGFRPPSGTIVRKATRS